MKLYQDDQDDPKSSKCSASRLQGFKQMILNVTKFESGIFVPKTSHSEARAPPNLEPKLWCGEHLTHPNAKAQVQPQNATTLIFCSFVFRDLLLTISRYSFILFQSGFVKDCPNKRNVGRRRAMNPMTASTLPMP